MRRARCACERAARSARPSLRLGTGWRRGMALSRSDVHRRAPTRGAVRVAARRGERRSARAGASVEPAAHAPATLPHRVDRPRRRARQRQLDCPDGRRFSLARDANRVVPLRRGAFRAVRAARRADDALEQRLHAARAAWRLALDRLPLRRCERARGRPARAPQVGGGRAPREHGPTVRARLARRRLGGHAGRTLRARRRRMA
jgi:hypothetical protein